MGFKLRPDGKIQLSENDVRNACLDLLRVNGWWPIRQHVGKFRAPDGGFITIGETGDPDYVVIKPPSFFVEFKRPGGKLSEAQLRRHCQLEKFYGLRTIVVASVEELDDWLKRARAAP